MKNFFAIISLYILSFSMPLYAQKIQGIVYDHQNNTPLGFAFVSVMNHSFGTVTNEEGHFSLDLSSFTPQDTLEIYFLGYTNYKIAKTDISSPLTIRLHPISQQIEEVIVTPNLISPQEILQKAYSKRNHNYKDKYSFQEVFRRTKSQSKVKELKIENKKIQSSFFSPQMSEEVIKKLPRNIIEYTDILYHVYRDSQEYKNIPIRAVTLDESGLNTMLEETFSGIEEYIMKKNKNEDTYWKIKSGWFLGTTLEQDDPPSSPSDTAELSNSDTLTSPSSHYQRLQKLKDRSVFRKTEDLFWDDLLKKPRKYHLKLLNIIDIRGEMAYEIDYISKNKKQAGKIYISTESYALLHRTTHLLAGTKGKGLALFGVSYRQKDFENSITYQKVGENYQLQHINLWEKIEFSIDRPLALLLKEKRFLTDKTLEEVKVKFNTSIENEYSEVILLAHRQAISQEGIDNKVFDPNFKIEQIDHYSPEIWKDYTTIEPTQLMMEYKRPSKKTEQNIRKENAP